MDLREEEQILKVIHHHPTPFVFDIFKVIIGAVPFFVILFLFKDILTASWFVLITLILLFVFALVVTYLALIYWLDKLVITNFRIVYVNWKYLTVRDESEALLDDIQDIQTHEKGIISYFRAFDYGDFRLETASAHVTIFFDRAPDPEGIRRYIYHVRKQ